MNKQRFDMLYQRSIEIAKEINELGDREQELWAEFERITLELKVLERLGWHLLDSKDEDENTE